MSAKIRGIMEARRAFARIPDAVREAVNDTNRTTAQEIVRQAQSRVARRTGLLASQIAFSQDTRRGTAKVGIKAGPAFYGHFIEFGTTRQPARPFMLPSVESQRGPHEARLRAARNRIERDVASVGGRFL